MSKMVLCAVCGNEIDQLRISCPYCRSRRPESGAAIRPGGVFRHKVVNLELGRPVVETALQRLQQEIDAARRDRIQVLTLIHGYGSSGKGGVIRRECRKTLEYLRSQGRVGEIIFGEEFSRKAGPIRSLLRRYPLLTKDRNMNRKNPGITVVVL